MPNIKIREALLMDLNAIYALFSLVDNLHRQRHPEIFREAANPTDIKEYLKTSIQSKDVTVFVADHRSVIVGAVLASIRQTPDIPVRAQQTFVNVENLVVVEAFRHQGVGKMLMERVHTWAEEHDLKQIQLTVYDFNEGAQAFYRQLGYEMLHHGMRKELP